MTAAVGDALPHRLWRRRWKAVLPSLQHQAFSTNPSDNQALDTEVSTNPRLLILRRSESTACTKPEARVTVTHAEHRSIPKRMVGISPKRERFAAASYSICALLAEVSASSPMT